MRHVIISHLNYLSYHFRTNLRKIRCKMRLLLILSGLLAIQAGVIKDEKDCEGIKINGVYYDSEELRSNIDRPYLLTVDYSTNNLFYSYNVKADEEEFKTAKLNLNTKDYSDVQGVNNGFAQTVDQENHEIYIGGVDGIYKYDYGSNEAKLIGERGTNIWNIYFKDVLYFSVYPSQFLYVFNEGGSTRFPDLEDTKVDHFAIDNEDTVFFSNATGLYGQKKGTKNAALYEEAPVMRSLTTDINGNVYACLRDGLYAVRKATKSLERIVTVDDCFGLAFDNDNNIVYSNATNIIRLKANKFKKC